MRTFARQVWRRAVVLGVVALAALSTGWEWLPWAVVVAGVAAGREAWLWRRHGVFVEATNEAWVNEARDSVPHVGADMAWAEELEGMLDRPLAIEATAVKVRTSELERVVREWSGAT